MGQSKTDEKNTPQGHILEFFLLLLKLNLDGNLNSMMGTIRAPFFPKSGYFFFDFQKR